MEQATEKIIIDWLRGKFGMNDKIYSHFIALNVMMLFNIGIGEASRVVSKFFATGETN